MLLHGNGEDSLVLQMEAGPSVLAPYAQPVPYEHNGERIVHGQRWEQTVCDIFLGWTTIDGRPFLVRHRPGTAQTEPARRLRALEN